MSSCPLLCCHGVSCTGTGIHPGFGERCTAGADGPGIETSESNSSCQKLLPSCLCPKGSAGLQPSTQHWQNSGEEEQEHDQPSEEMRRKGLRAVKRETSTRNQDKEGRERRWIHSLEEPVKWQEENEPRLSKQYLPFFCSCASITGCAQAAYMRFEIDFVNYSCLLLSPFIIQPQEGKAAVQRTRVEMWK